MEDAQTLILNAIGQKHCKGEPYAAGKTLIVFLEGDAGEWFPSKVAQQLPDPLLFKEVWVVGLQGVFEGEYVYNVTRLDISEGVAPVARVRLGKQFDTWAVEWFQ
jgi:hypothetical protein